MLSSGKTTILVDLGFGPKSLRRRLEQAELEEKVDALIVTHGHLDHTSGIPSFAKEEPVPILLSAGTLNESPQLQAVEQVQLFQMGLDFVIGDIWITPFSIPHDSADPVGFRFRVNGIVGAVATDLGEITPEVRAGLRGCDWLVLEANHDESMVQIGPYPWQIKQRVLSKTGHLSNRCLAHFLERDFDGSAAHILLAHISQSNNHPEVALAQAQRALEDRGLPLAARPNLHLTHQSKPSIVLDL